MTLDRRAIGDALNRLAFAAEILDDDTVDAKTCAGLAWGLRSAEGELTLERIASMDGMSTPILAVIDDAANDREAPLLAALEARVPPGLLEVRRLKGLGPKKIRALWQQLDITSVGELEYACTENRLVELKGFGQKTQESVLEQIAALRARAGLLRLDQGRAVALQLAAVLEALHPVDAAGRGVRTAVAGDVRRGVEVVAEVALVTTAPVAAAVAAVARCAAAEADEDAAPGAAAGAPRALAPEVRVEGAFVRGRVGTIAVLVRAGVPDARFAAALIVDTGSGAHVEALRARAKARGLTLEEIEAADEDGVYAALDLVATDPERREVGVPLVEKGSARPRLITRADLQGSLHNHTTASDGTASMREMRDAAAARGMRYLAITDHSKSAVYAKGLGPSSLEAQREEARTLNGEGTGTPACTLVTGVESDILKDGALDYTPEVLRALEIVVSSVHSRFGQKGADLTARMVAAAHNQYTDVVGHPTGRLLLGRAPSEYDVSALLEACATSGCAVELNANPARLDLNERHLAEARARRIPVSIAADAHSIDALDHLEYGVIIARRAGLTVEDVLNARPLAELRAWLSARRTRARANA